MLDVGIKETTTTTGNGAVALSAVAGFARFSEAFSEGEGVTCLFTLPNGDKEWALCRVGAGNTLERITVSRSLVGGVLTKFPASPLELSGTTEVACVDDGFSDGGAAPFLSIPGVTQYMCPYIASASNLTSASQIGGIVGLVPWSVSNPIKWDGMGFATTGAASQAGKFGYVGVCESYWGADGTCRPGRVIITAGPHSLDVSGDKVSTGINFRPVPGRVYWSWIWLEHSTGARTVPPSACKLIAGHGANTFYPITGLALSGYPGMPVGDISTIGVVTNNVIPYIFFTP